MRELQPDAIVTLVAGEIPPRGRRSGWLPDAITGRDEAPSRRWLADPGIANHRHTPTRPGRLLGPALATHLPNGQPYARTRGGI
jgi:hypothetical protein